MPREDRPSLAARAAGWIGVIALGAGLVWFIWYGYEDGRTTSRSLQVIGLLRDVQTCIGLSHASYQRALVPGEEFRGIPAMKTTPYAARLDWDSTVYRATATFADVHRDYDGRTLWIAAADNQAGGLRWTCGTTVATSARSYGNLASFLERCDRALSADLGTIEYCGRYVPLPVRGQQ